MEISIENFVTNFAAQFENTDASLINATTAFKELEEWDSMMALSLIAMADDSYNVKLTGEEIRNSNTVEDIYNIIAAKAK